MDHTADSSRGLLPAPPFSLLFWKAEHRAAGCPDESAAPVGIVTFTLPPPCRLHCPVSRKGPCRRGSQHDHP